MAAVGLAVACVLGFMVLFWWYMKWLRVKRLVDKIPGPRAFPVVGNVHQFKKNPDEWFEHACGMGLMYQKPRMIRIWLAVFPMVMVYGAEEAEVILTSKKHLNKGREYDLLHPWLGLGLLTSCAEKWRPRRKLLTPTFHFDILKDFMEVFNRESKMMVDKFAKSVGEVDTDVYMMVTLCALDIICETAMGRNVGAQNDSNSDYVTAIYKINDIIHERQKKPWLRSDILFNWIGRGTEQRWCLDVIHGFTEKVIHERYKEVKGHGCKEASFRRKAFLDLLLDLVEKKQLPMEEVRNEVDTFMFEGHDTTAASMNWLIHLLGCYPEIQSKVHQELDTALGHGERDLGHEDLKNLPYLESCIKEALRLFPSVPLFARANQEDCIISGYHIPRGTQVFINPFMVHRDPKHWPDPEVFNPDRFRPDNLVGRHPFSYLPFSAGSRNCIGQRFALMEEKTVMAWLFRRFQLRSLHRRDQVRPKAQLILRPCNGIHVSVQFRPDNGFLKFRADQHT